MRPTPAKFAGSLLAQLAGLADINPLSIYTGSAEVAFGTTSVFVKTALGNGIAGRVVGVAFWWEAEDYATSPVSLVALAAQGSGNSASQSAQGGSPWTIPLTPDAQTPFWFPPPYAIPFQAGWAMGLEITNNEASGTYHAEGLIAVSWYSPDTRIDAEDEVLKGGSPWEERVFS